MPIAGKIQEKIYCPVCGAHMRLINGKYGPFYGCGSYPNCKKTVKTFEAYKYTEPPAPKVDVTPSEYQTAIADWVLHGQGHGVVEAFAGSGKTWTNVWIGNKLSRFLGVAFNKHIAEEWKSKSSTGKIVTTHSFGLWTIRRNFNGKDIKIDDKKVWHILQPMLDSQPLEDEDKRAVGLTVKKLVDLARNTLNYDIDSLAEYYGVPLNGDYQLIQMLFKMTLEQCQRTLHEIDFADMLWLPHVLHLDAPKFPFVLADECQDFNNAQHALIENALEPGGRLLAVGDRYQSLYGFRGANVDSIPNTIEKFDAQTFPLPITYRCPKAVVELAQLFVPDIQAAPWAEEGEVRTVTEAEAMCDVKEGDMILCRTNAPLVRPIYGLIRQGIKATIRGRDIGQGLIALVEKFEKKSLDLNDLLRRLANYKEREMTKLLAVEKNSQAQSVEDRVDTIWAVSEDTQTPDKLKDKISEIFADTKPSVVGSSIHRAKGLEADNVVVLRPDLMPHSLAKKDWELIQERNIQYVCATRAKKTLTYAVKEG